MRAVLPECDALTVPSWALGVLYALEAAGGETWVVGGAVRDAWLGRAAQDIDLACNLPAAAAADMLRAAGYAVIPTGLAHGTVTVVADGHGVEVTTFRTDGTYSDGRHPDSVGTASCIEEDLARRDFTMNALAYHPARGFVDPFGGVDALRAREITCVGEAEARFSEDALRILRAVRFAAQLGFTIEAVTDAALRAAAEAGRLANLAAERVSAELQRTLCGAWVGEVLRHYPDVLAHIIPEIAACVGFPQTTPYHCYDVWEHIVHTVDAMPSEPLGRMAALLHDIAKPACHVMTDGRSHFYGHAPKSAEVAARVAQDLRLPRVMSEDLYALVRYHDDPIAPEPRPIRRYLTKLGGKPELFEVLCDLKAADALAHAPEYRGRAVEAQALRAELHRMLEAREPFGVRDLMVNGHDLQALGMQEGPAVGQVLRRLFDEVVEGRVENTREALLDVARAWVDGEGAE